MVEMTPEHLEAQVEMELQEAEDREGGGIGGTGAEAEVADFSHRLIDKKAKEEPEDSGPAVAVDPLSLCSLLSQGFEEGPARRALRMHHNDTQAALDWLINGQGQDIEKKKQAEEGVRMPTTVKHVKKLKAMRKAQQEKLREKRESRDGREGTPKASSAESSDARRDSAAAEAPPERERKPSAAPVDLMDMVSGDGPGPALESRSAATTLDLLNMDDSAPAETTDMSKTIVRTELPTHIAFDTSRCEKQPLPASLAAGTAAPRSAMSGDGGMGVAVQAAQAGGMSPELLAQVQALAAQSHFTPEQLLLAAQQLAGAGGQPALQSQVAAPLASSSGGLPGGYPISPQVPTASAMAMSGGFAVTAGLDGQPARQISPSKAQGTFQGLDPLGSDTGPPQRQGSKPKPKDDFGDLALLGPGNS